MSNREKLKKLAEAVNEISDWTCPFGKAEKELMLEWQAKMSDPSTILALLSELEQAEAHWQPSEKLLFKKLTEAEAALRTLREVSQPCRIWLEAIALDYPEGSIVRSKSQNLSDALAAALAAEGGGK